MKWSLKRKRSLAEKEFLSSNDRRVANSTHRNDSRSRNDSQAIIRSFAEESKTKLLHAILLDPQAPTYYQACAMIDEMCELQKEILPKLEWK